MKFEKSPKTGYFFKSVSPWFFSKNRIFYHGYTLGKSRQKRPSYSG